MRNEEVKAIFDQQAAGYDRQWARMAPIRAGLHFLLDSVFARLPPDARILCVGAGTGVEIAHLAASFPHWRFTAVEPSGPMLDVCRDRARTEGFESRCSFHEGFLDSLPGDDGHHAATSLLVSQFILDRRDRAAFFRAIADRLLHGGVLASADLASGATAHDYQPLLAAWVDMMAAAGIPAEGLERMREAYANDVAVLPPGEIAAIIRAGGFDAPVQFFQAGLIHAWACRRGTAVSQ
jgi:tRNA (cmo5U34)-methyltransferase